MKAVARIFKNSGKPTIALLIASAVLVVILLLMALYIGIVLNNVHFYDGIFIGDVAVGGMTTEEATAAIAERYDSQLSKTVTLRVLDAEQLISLPELGATINELICLSNMENINAVLINEGIAQADRLVKLNQIAIQQMQVLEENGNRNLLK